MQYQTYHDLVESLVISSYGGAQDAEQRDIRTAVQRAHQELGWVRDWEWHQQHGRVVIQPSWSGTATFVASTRTLTRVSGNPFPAAADYYHVRINDVVAKVQSRTSDNVLVLDPAVTYPQDFSTATQATIYRTIYPLPADFRNLDTPVDENSWSMFNYVSQNVAFKMERVLDVTGPQAYWTVARDEQSNGWVIKILGRPERIETIDFFYRRSPRALRFSGHEAGSRAGTVTSAGTAVTGSGTAFTQAMVGSILRFGTSESHPEPLGAMNPWQAEAKIAAVSSATAITLETPVTATAVKYVITDPVDFPAGMTNCLHSACDYWLARIRKDKEDRAFALYQRDLRLAMENDALSPIEGRRILVWDLAGWRSTPLPDGGV